MRNVSEMKNESEGNKSGELGLIKSLISKTPNNKFSDEELRDKSFFELLDQKYKEIGDEKEKQKNVSTYDTPRLEEEKSAREQFYRDRGDSSWRQRLNYMWTTDEYGNLGPELRFVWEGTFGAFIAAAVYGSYVESAKIYRIFLEQNKYTMFQHPREAQRALQDRVVLAMMQGGWKAGWRFSLLTATFLSVTQSLTVIRWSPPTSQHQNDPSYLHISEITSTLWTMLREGWPWELCTGSTWGPGACSGRGWPGACTAWGPGSS